MYIYTFFYFVHKFSYVKLNRYQLNINFKIKTVNYPFCVSGKVDYIGSSHQWWHFLVVLALYYWHNTGILYIEYRMNHGCVNDLRL